MACKGDMRVILSILGTMQPHHISIHGSTHLSLLFSCGYFAHMWCMLGHTVYIKGRLSLFVFIDLCTKINFQHCIGKEVCKSAVFVSLEITNFYYISKMHRTHFL